MRVLRSLTLSASMYVSVGRIASDMRFNADWVKRTLQCMATLGLVRDKRRPGRTTLVAFRDPPDWTGRPRPALPQSPGRWHDKSTPHPAPGSRLDTGLQAGELTGLRVRDLEWAPGARKGWPWREVPLLPGMACRPLLRRLIQGKPGEAFVFPGRAGGRLAVRGVERRFASLCEAAGIAAVPHDLPHTCATRMVSRGVDILAIQRLLGRNSVQTTQRCGRLGDREYRRALEAGLS